jgi:hypothetical protein
MASTYKGFDFEKRGDRNHHHEKGKKRKKEKKKFGGKGR